MANTERKLGWYVVTGITTLLMIVSLGAIFYVIVAPGLAMEVVAAFLAVVILGLFLIVSKYVFPYFSAPYSRVGDEPYLLDLESGLSESKK